jgi:hypothetical protein
MAMIPAFLIALPSNCVEILENCINMEDVNSLDCCVLINASWLNKNKPGQ